MESFADFTVFSLEQAFLKETSTENLSVSAPDFDLDGGRDIETLFQDPKF
jgi:hypothetical protein